MYSVYFTEPSEEDIIESVQYISDVLKAPIAAKQLINEIEETVKILENTPFCNALVKNEYLGSKGIRTLLVKNYQLFYTINELNKKVTVIRVLHARRDWANILSSE